MNKLSDLWLKACVLASLGLSSNAFASSANEIFEPVTDKTNEIREAVALWSTSIVILVCVVVGLWTTFGNFPKKWAANVAAGATIIVGAVNIGTYLLT